MNTKLLIATIALASFGAVGTAQANGHGHVHVRIGAPVAVRHVHVAAPVVAVAPARVSSTCVWVEGHWKWHGYEEVWVPGHCAHRTAYVAPAVTYAPAPVGVSIGFSGRF